VGAVGACLQVQPEDVALFVYCVAMLISLGCLQRYALVADGALRQFLSLGYQAGMELRGIDAMTAMHPLHWNNSNFWERTTYAILLRWLNESRSANVQRTKNFGKRPSRGSHADSQLWHSRAIHFAGRTL
jgi:hypothetical protein